MILFNRSVIGSCNMFAIYCSFFFIVFSNLSPLTHAYDDIYSWSMEQDDVPSPIDFPERSGQNDDQDEGNTNNNSSSSQFGYQDTDEWGEYYPNCRGNRQSPIDIDYHSVTRLTLSSPIIWTGYDTIPSNMTITNNGHTVHLSTSWDNDDPPYISGGVLSGEYVFHHLHYHWGDTDLTGSEHTISNHSTVLEMHMVHWKREYGSASEATNYEDGLAVVGVLFRIGYFQNSGLVILQNFMRNITNPGTSESIQPFALSALNIDFGTKYFTYMGSLTTPPCTEVVTWILPAIPQILSEGQINNFRDIQLSGGDTHNYRPTMPLNNRIVYFILQ